MIKINSHSKRSRYILHPFKKTRFKYTNWRARVHRRLVYMFLLSVLSVSKIVSEYDQEIPQSQTADNLWHLEEEPLNHHETPGRQIKQSNQLSLQVVISKNKTNVLFREIARLITRNSYIVLQT